MAGFELRGSRAKLPLPLMKKMKMKKKKRNTEFCPRELSEREKRVQLGIEVAVFISFLVFVAEALKP